MAGEEDIEVIYEAPARTRAWWGAAFGGLVFVAGVAWIVAQMLHRTGALAAVVALVALAFAWPWITGRRGPLRARRVVTHRGRRELAIEHGGGAVTLSWSEVKGVESGEELIGEGVPVDVVTVRRAGGEALRFSVIDRGAAEGAARALRAALGLGERPGAGVDGGSDEAGATGKETAS